MKLRDKTITVTLGEDLYVKAPHVFQYDYGLMLVLDGVQLPADYEVHFSNKKHGVAKKAEVTENGVKIPDEYLRSGEDIYAWVYLRNGDEDGYTVYSVQIPVISRSVEEGDDVSTVQHNIIDKAIEALNEAVEQTEQNVLKYPYINEDKYWMVYDAQQEAFVNTGILADGGNLFDLEIGTVTTLAPGAEATASVTWDGDTALLNLGLPAGDTSNLVSIHNEVTGGEDGSVHVYDGADGLGIDSIIVKISPKQGGSGEPSPRNIRAISGTTGITLTQTNNTGSESYEVSFEDTAGIVYSGNYFPIDGRLLVSHVLITKRCVDMDNTSIQPGWRNSGIRDIVGENVSQIFEDQVLNVGTSYGVDTTGENDLLYLGYEQYGLRQSDWINTEITVQICVALPEPVVYTVREFMPTVELGENRFELDQNSAEISYMKYPCDTKLYIDRRIAALEALILEHE